MSIPNRILQELGESAARFNKRAVEHPGGCCSVCRRLLVDMVTTLTDALNWEPAPLSHQIAQLQAQLQELEAAYRVQQGPPARPTEAPAAPSSIGPDEPGFFEPPPPGGFNSREE